MKVIEKKNHKGPIFLKPVIGKTNPRVEHVKWRRRGHFCSFYDAHQTDVVSSVMKR